MDDSDDAPAEAPSRVNVRAFSPLARAATLGLGALGAANVAYLAYHLGNDVVEGSENAPPLVVALGLGLFTGLPWALARLIDHLAKGTLALDGEQLVLALRRDRYEIPIASITGARPLHVPFPGAGVALALRSGRTFERRLVAAAAGDLLALLGRAVPAAADLRGRGAVAFGVERAARAHYRWPFWAVKYGALPLALTVVAFRLHQYIMFGGPFGQYRLHGLAAYLRTFADFWCGILGALVVYAVVVRLALEVVTFLATWALPARAALFRRGAEAVSHAAYFVVVPGFVALRLLA